MQWQNFAHENKTYPVGDCTFSSAVSSTAYPCNLEQNINVCAGGLTVCNVTIHYTCLRSSHFEGQLHSADMTEVPEFTTTFPIQLKIIIGYLKLAKCISVKIHAIENNCMLRKSIS